MRSSNPDSVDAYIAGFPKDVQKKLQAIRKTVRSVAPGAEEKIGYGMPAYKFHGALVYFAGYEHHIGFYPAPVGISSFQKELSVYKTGKGSVQFPLDQPIPLDLIERIVKFRVKQNLLKTEKRRRK